MTAVRRGVGKSGQPYGFVTIEDYNGSFELPLWGQDWANWGRYMDVGNALYITARVQPRRFNPNKLEIAVGKIDFLNDVKDSLIESITIQIPLNMLNEDIVVAFEEFSINSPGHAAIYFHILDPEGKQHVKLHSRNRQITVNKQLIDFINSKPGLSYQIN